MMQAAAITLLLASANAFSTIPVRRSFKTFASTDNGDATTASNENVDIFQVDLEKLADESAAEASQPKFEAPTPVMTRKAPRQAGWFPLLLAPFHLDGTYAGKFLGNTRSHLYSFNCSM
jgi:hypothetical protein